MFLRCTNPEWAVIVPGGSFSEISAWFSKITAANSDDYNVSIGVVKHNSR